MRKRMTFIQKGDLYKGVIGNSNVPHVYMILENCPNPEEVCCLSTCNFTGSYVPEGHPTITLSSNNVPDNWFDFKKNTSSLRYSGDCVYITEVSSHLPLGNINYYPELKKEICEGEGYDDFSKDLEDICNCNN